MQRLEKTETEGMAPRTVVVLVVCASMCVAEAAPRAVDAAEPACRWSWRSLGCLPASECKLTWKLRPRCVAKAKAVPPAECSSATANEVAAFEPSQKEHFNEVYNLPDPRLYYRGLLPTSYRAPLVMARALQAFTTDANDGKPLRVIDFACGYGGIGAMLRHNLTMEELYTYYSSTSTTSSTLTNRIAMDRDWYGRHRSDAPAVHITGLEVAERAMGYAAEMGLIDAIAHEDLTASEPSAELRRTLQAADLLVEAGSVSHGGVQLGVFRSILATGARPWIVRISRPDADLHLVEEFLTSSGYQTDYFGPLVRYRKPLGSDEEVRVLDLATTLGKGAEEAISGGYIVARLSVSRPAADISRWPIDTLEQRCQALGCFD